MLTAVVMTQVSHTLYTDSSCYRCWLELSFLHGCIQSWLATMCHWGLYRVLRHHDKQWKMVDVASLPRFADVPITAFWRNQRVGSVHCTFRLIKNSAYLES